jgi:hypothetical protein
MYNECYYDEECPSEDDFCYGEEYDRQWGYSSDDSDVESDYDASAVADAPVKTDCANYTEAMYNLCYYDEECPTEDEFCYGEEYDRQWADSSDDSDFESGYDASAVADAPVKTDCANYTEAMYNECYYDEECPTEDEFCYGEADE